MEEQFLLQDSTKQHVVYSKSQSFPNEMQIR